MTLDKVFHDLTYMMPELALIITLCAVVIVDSTQPMERSARWSAAMSLVGVTLAFFVVVFSYGNRYHSVFTMFHDTPGGAAQTASTGPDRAFSGVLVVDKLSDFFKIVILLGTFAVILFSTRSKELKGYRMGEYYTLMLASSLGASFLVSSNNYLMLVLSLETLSLCSYVLAGYLKHDRKSAESSLKYILYGSVASGVMLFGISYIYGMAGTLNIRQSLFNIAMREDDALAVLLALTLVLGGMGFKMAAVPFHFWAPDVYQGAPTPITAFLAIVSKAAGFSALLRVMLPLFAIDGSVVPDNILAVRGSLQAIVQDGHLPLLFWIISASTMTVGNLIAIRQTDLKRLLAYSSIAHAGYLLMCMTVYNNQSLEAMLFYLFMYMFMNLGAFAVVIVLINQTGSSDIQTYRGLVYRNPMLAILMFIFLISLTGIPPTAGFIGKLMLFYAVVGAGSSAATAGGQWFYLSLAVIGGINTAISLYYYMRVAKVMIFDQPKEEAPFKIGAFDWLSISFYGAAVFVLFFNFAPVITLVQLFER